MIADFCCGGECGQVGAGSAPVPEKRHWRTSVGPVTSQGTFARNSGLALRFKPIGTAGEICYIRRDPDVLTDNHRWARGYVYFNALPSTDSDIIQFTLAGGNPSTIRYRTATQDIIANVGSTTTGATAQAVVTGQWYRIDMKTDASGSSTTMSMTVDGVDKGTASRVQAASVITAIRVGAQCSGATALTADVIWDDFITGLDNSQYPVGPGQIVGLKPNVDGAHSFNSGEFIYNAAGGNIDPAAEDVYTYLDHTMGSITDFINAATAAAESYIEVGFEDMPPTTFVNGVEVVSSHHAASSTANLQSMRLLDGVVEDVVFADSDFSQTGIVYFSKHYSQAPASVDENTGIGWSKAGIDGVKIRWGSSWAVADVNPDAYLDAVMLEVDFIFGANSTGSGSPARRVSASASGTASQCFNGSGSPSKTLSRSASGAAKLIFNATAAGVKTLLAVGAGVASLRFNGSGAPARRVSASASGVANSTGNVFGTGSPSRRVTGFGTGSAINGPHVDIPIIPQTGRGGSKPIRRVFIRRDVDAEPVLPRRKAPRAPGIVYEAREAPVTPMEALPEIAPRQVSQEAWDRIRTVVRVQEILARAKETYEPIGDPDMRLLRHFVEMMGGPVPGVDDEDQMPFMLKRFLRMGKGGK